MPLPLILLFNSSNFGSHEHCFHYLRRAGVDSAAVAGRFVVCGIEELPMCRGHRFCSHAMNRRLLLLLHSPRITHLTTSQVIESKCYCITRKQNSLSIVIYRLVVESRLLLQEIKPLLHLGSTCMPRHGCSLRDGDGVIGVCAPPAPFSILRMMCPYGRQTNCSLSPLCRSPPI